jgi:hypothetical protein
MRGDRREASPQPQSVRWKQVKEGQQAGEREGKKMGVGKGRGEGEGGGLICAGDQTSPPTPRQAGPGGGSGRIGEKQLCERRRRALRRRTVAGPEVAAAPSCAPARALPLIVRRLQKRAGRRQTRPPRTTCAGTCAGSVAAGAGCGGSGRRRCDGPLAEGEGGVRGRLCVHLRRSTAAPPSTSAQTRPEWKESRVRDRGGRGPGAASGAVSKRG